MRVVHPPLTGAGREPVDFARNLESAGQGQT